MQIYLFERLRGILGNAPLVIDLYYHMLLVGIKLPFFKAFNTLDLDFNSE